MKSKTTTAKIQTALPEHYQKIAGKTFSLPLNSHRLYIRIRTKNLDVKPPLYLFDTDNNSFVSSLYYNPHDERWIFDITQNEKRHFFSLDTSLKVYPEETGYYQSDSATYEKLKQVLL